MRHVFKIYINLALVYDSGTVGQQWNRVPEGRLGESLRSAGERQWRVSPARLRGSTGRARGQWNHEAGGTLSLAQYRGRPPVPVYPKRPVM